MLSSARRASRYAEMPPAIAQHQAYICRLRLGHRSVHAHRGPRDAAQASFLKYERPRDDDLRGSVKLQFQEDLAAEVATRPTTYSGGEVAPHRGPRPSSPLLSSGSRFSRRSHKEECHLPCLQRTTHQQETLCGRLRLLRADRACSPESSSRRLCRLAAC